MPKILIVEDEGIVAKSIQNRLEKMGYTVPAIVSSGEEVLDAAISTQPDVVLMDIHLKSRMDGVEAVKLMQQHMKVPVIYLTAYADDETLKRAIETTPNGYIVKPFSQVDLKAAIENALHRHQKEIKEEKNLKRIMETLNYISDGIVITDEKGTITAINRIALNLIGCKHNVLGKNVDEILFLVDTNKIPIVNPISQAVSEHRVILLDKGTMLVSQGGNKHVVDFCVVPLYENLENLGSTACVFSTTVK